MPTNSVTDANIVECNKAYDDIVPGFPAHEYILERMILGKSNRIAWVDSSTKKGWTNDQIVDDVRHLSAGLQATEGLTKGQFIGLALPNCAEFIVSALAVMRCGGVVAMVNPAYTIKELEHVAGITKPAFWICTPDLLPSLKQLGPSGVSSKAVVIDLKDPSSSQWHRLLASGKPERFVSPALDVFQDLATMPFSSGTTGLPKGVMLTHHNIVTGILQSKWWSIYDETDTIMGVTPLYHQYGFLLALASLAIGSRLVNMPKFSFIDMLEAIQELKVTMLPLVPPIALLFAKHPAVDQYDLRSVKVVLSGAAPLGLEVIQHLRRKFGWDIVQAYGMTECTVASHLTPRRMEDSKHPSVGLVLPFFQAKVVDTKTGQALGPHKTGEICMKGRMVMKGYRENPVATSEAIDQDGWLHSGDIGYYDEEGYFFITDRIKELIKYKGFQVAPSELENVLLSHPDVTDAAVIGVPDEMAGELPRAYVVKRAGSSVNEKDIASFADGQVSPFKYLRVGVIFVPAIPKSLSGKILRRQLTSNL